MSSVRCLQSVRAFRPRWLSPLLPLMPFLSPGGTTDCPFGREGSSGGRPLLCLEAGNFNGRWSCALFSCSVCQQSQDINICLATKPRYQHLSGNKVKTSTFVCQQSQDINICLATKPRYQHLSVNKSDSMPLSKPSRTLAYNEYLTSVTTDLTSMTTEPTSMTTELTTD